MHIAPRTIVASLILLVGLGGAFWITNPSLLRREGGAVLSITEGTSTDPRFATGEVGLTANETGSTADISEENVVRNYGKEILRLNPLGQGVNAPIKVPTEQQLAGLIQEEISKPISVTLYTEKDIVLATSSNKSAFITYINAVNAANKKTVDTLPVSFAAAIANAVSNGEMQNLTMHVNKLTLYITALLAIPVPPNLKQFHLDMVNLLQRRVAYARAILENNGSQLKIVAALNAINAMTDEETQIYDAFNAEKARILK